MRLRFSGWPRAFVLLSVLVVIMLVSMVAVSLIFRLRAEELATAAGQGGEQGWLAALSGVYAAIRVAAGSRPGELAWQDNPDLLRNQLVYDDGSERWFFTVFSGEEDGPEPVRYGLTDEAGKLNLLEADEDRLSKLPQMTTDRVHALLDFLDIDSEPRPEGAEQEYYDQLSLPYPIRNGPLNTLEEVLLVRGFTPGLFYGEDANLNYRLDSNEDDGDEQFPPDNANGRLNQGLRPYLTVVAYDRNVTEEGSPRINLNDPLAPYNESDYPQPLAAYIEALRRSQDTLSHPADLLLAKRGFKGEDGAEIELESGVGSEELPLALDHFTTTDKERLPGLINVNTASTWVLQTVPGIDNMLAQSIVSTRRGLDPIRRKSVAWLFQENLVDETRFKQIAPFLTARSLQFHFQVVGFSVPSGRYRVLEAAIDLGSGRPVVSYLRDITQLGLPFNIRAEYEDTDG